MNDRLLFVLLVLSLLISNSCPKDENHPTKQESRTYQQVRQHIDQIRLELKSEYEHAQTDSGKNKIINRAKNVFFHAIYESLIPFWYGTEWGFNGITEIPGQGQIACGYFVTTVLRDAGLVIDRARLAQIASETMIKKLTAEQFIKRFRNVPIEKFVDSIRNWSIGIYVVGLDCHTGFIINSGDQVWFIHSSYMEPLKVIKEKAKNSPILRSSVYRVIGNLTEDEAVIRKWLLGESF